MEMQQEEAPLDNGCSPLPLKRNLIYQEQQAFDGAKMVYYLALPASMIVITLAHGYQMQETDYSQKQSIVEFILMVLSLGVSYWLAMLQYIKCNQIDVTPVRGERGEDNKEIQEDITKEKSMININRGLTLVKPPKHFCPYCQILIDYRTRHCKKCQTCIQRYDHHCFWIGNCVGRHNHLHFYLFLLFQTINNILLFLSLYSITFISHLPPSLITSILSFIFYGMIVFAVGFIAFTGFLLIYHTMLICNGITTWQHMRREKISYLKYLPKGYNPFSLGVKQNIIRFFTQQTRGNGSNALQEWEECVPTYQEAKHLQPVCNLIDNQYYSCC